MRFWFLEVAHATFKLLMIPRCKEMIRESLISCAVTCATDGSQDDEITCFKKDQPCSAGREMLKEQLNYMNTIESNP